jgi:DNA mismatch endonuclease, patch repair protein
MRTISGKSYDSLTPEQRSERMGRIKNKNTKPELQVRQLVWSLGFRYRLHNRKLPGSPDLVFAKRKKAIFVHGCFWHQHGGECRQYRMPRSKLDFWLPKLEGNKQRDARNQQILIEMGWSYLIIWECELKGKGELANRILTFLEAKQ